MYEITLADTAKKQLKKLDKEIQNRFGSVIERIKIRPFRFVKRKEGSSDYILRIGEYRAIIDINNKENLITVLEIGHRKNIYNR